jgi:SnoaL-like domain
MSSRGPIENVLHRYAFAYDYNDMTDLADTFAEKAVLTMRIAGGDLVGPFEGRDAVMAVLARGASNRTRPVRHVTTNMVVRSQDGERTEASSYVTLCAVLDGQVKVLSTGRYDDELVREADGAWRFSRRHIELDVALE